MNRQISGLLGIIGALGLTASACKDNPVADGSGTPSLIVSSPSEITLQGTGKSVGLTAQVLDKTSTPLAQTITATACNSALTVVPNAIQPVPATALNVTATSAGLNASCVVFSSNGAPPDTAKVIILPTVFPGTVSPTTAQGGGTVVIHSTATLKFNPATVGVRFVAGSDTVPGLVAGASADTVAVLVPFGTSGVPVISGVVVTYVAGLETELAATTSVTQSGAKWTAMDSWQTAPDITSLLPGAGGTSVLLINLPATDNSAVCPEVALGFGSAGPCSMLKFTVAAATSLNFTVDWVGDATDPDVDVYSCSDSTVANFGAACFEDGGNGATGSKPQTTKSFTYPAGTHWFVVENYAGTQSKNIYITITNP